MTTRYRAALSSPGSNPSSSAAAAIFSDLKYDFVYETNANTGNPIVFKTLTNLNLNQSVGSGSECSKYNTYCVVALLNDAKNDVCDVEEGQGPSTTSGGYLYAFEDQPETDGCYASSP